MINNALVLSYDAAILSECARQMLLGMGHDVAENNGILAVRHNGDGPSVKLRSTITLAERIRQFGNITDNPYNPSSAEEREARIASRERVYEDTQTYEISDWILPLRGVDAAQSSPENGANWLNTQARLLQKWCDEGHWEVIGIGSRSLIRHLSRAGSTTSERKATSSAENGKKGGRPRKTA